MKKTLLILAFLILSGCTSGTEDLIDLGYEFTKDDTHIYYYDEIFEQGDLETFKVLDTDYAMDKNSVFF